MDKLSREYIESLIENEEYIILGAKTTVCFLQLNNGFEVVGSSACVNPQNFDTEIGEKVAREDAVNKIWMVEGYLLQTQMDK